MKKLFAFVLLVGVLLAVYARIEAFNIKLVEYRLESRDIPKAFNGYKIAFVSDFHTNIFSDGTKKIKKAVEIVNAKDVDLVLIGGDFSNGGADFSKEPVYEASGFKAKDGIFAVSGNHDFCADKSCTGKLFFENLAKSGIVLLDNISKKIFRGNEYIFISGLPDLWWGEQSTSKSLYGILKSDYNIMLSHNPDSSEYIATDLVDIMLSGHTHGGEINLPVINQFIVPSSFGLKYIYGFAQSPFTKVYTTSGVGSITPFRLFAQPEVVIFTLSQP